MTLYGRSIVEASRFLLLESSDFQVHHTMLQRRMHAVSPPAKDPRADRDIDRITARLKRGNVFFFPNNIPGS